jgi:hypothetical protein
MVKIIETTQFRRVRHMNIFSKFLKAKYAHFKNNILQILAKNLLIVHCSKPVRYKNEQK